MAMPDSIPISFHKVCEENIMQLRKLNMVIFPLQYQDKFYKDALSSGDFTKLAYYGDVCVGSVACRLEKIEGKPGVKLYIMTLGVLAPYRRLGIGSKLLKTTMEQSEKDPNITEVYVHVQTNNDAAIELYRKCEFEITHKILKYYKRIEPPDCFVLSRSLISTPHVHAPDSAGKS